MSSSVVKIKSKFPNISGTRPSIRNSQLLISSGIPTLDHIFGGGLPIGSIFLLEEDTYGMYSEIMLKYFMSEGIVSQHDLFIASQNKYPSKFISELPAVVKDSNAQETPNFDDDQMKIAWRYQNLKLVDSSPTGQAFGHFYDLTKYMGTDDLKDTNITQWDGKNDNIESSLFNNPSYEHLLNDIKNTIENGGFYTSAAPDKRNILRIVIHSLGSRMWLSETEQTTYQDISKFLYYLRAILRDSYAVATITIPVNQLNNSDAIIERIEHISDIGIHLEGFSGSDKELNPLFKDYHGLLYIKKLPATNTLTSHNPDSRDFVFKLRRKKFVVEILHLPPELEDTVQREQDETVPLGLTCSVGTRKSLLDF